MGWRKEIFVYVAALVLCLYLTPTLAQLGKDCSAHRACGLHQSCFNGYCVCDRGYIRASSHNCFQVRKYGEICYHDEQCVDHRMTCQLEHVENSTAKRCMCDKFHEWNEETEDCVGVLNVTVVLGNLDSRNISEEIMKEANALFIWIGWLGLSVSVIIGCIAVGLIIYGCCLYECYDKCVGDNEISPTCPPSCRNYKRQEDLTSTRQFSSSPKAC